MSDRLDNTIIVPIIDLVQSSKNPRKITEVGLVQLKKEILSDPEYMLHRPILVNNQNGMLVVYAGNQRLLACKELGIETVPVRVSEGISQEVLDQRMLGDNITRGVFDMGKIDTDFPDELGFMEQVAEFTDLDLNVVFKDSSELKKPKIHTTRLTFQLKEDLHLFYSLLDDLANSYPDEAVSQRLKNFVEENI